MTTSLWCPRCAITLVVDDAGTLDEDEWDDRVQQKIAEARAIGCVHPLMQGSWTEQELAQRQADFDSTWGWRKTLPNAGS